MGLSSGSQAYVEGNEGLVPAECRRKRRSKQRTSQPSPAAGDAPLALMLPTVVVEGREPREGCSLLAADTAELGHADQERERGAFADPGNAEHEVKSDSEISVST